MYHKALLSFLLLVSFCFSSVLQAQTAFTSEPHKVVQDATNKVLTVLESGVDPVRESKKFTQELSNILEPAVAFNYIAKAVMGQYAKQVSPDQVKQFSEAFKEGLVSTYGKGMANFRDFEIVVLPPEQALGKARSVAVVQEVRGAASATQISYSMRQNKQGQWKMVNMVLNGINLGQTFRGQFAAAVAKNKGDVVKAIAEWGR